MSMVNVGFPVYCVTSCRLPVNVPSSASPSSSLLATQSPTPYYVVVGGGGGASKSGVPNGLRLYAYAPHSGNAFRLLDTVDSQGDAVMCMDRCAVKLDSFSLACGVGIRGWFVACTRGAGADDLGLFLLASAQTDLGGDGEGDPHQRLVSARATQVATAACDGAVRLWNVSHSEGWEECNALLFPGQLESVSDVCMVKDNVVLVTLDHTDLLLCKVDNGRWCKRSLELKGRQAGYSIRCCRTIDNSGDLIVVLINRRERRSVLQIYDFESMELLSTTAPVAHLVTCMCVTRNLVSAGCSDGSVLIYHIDDIWLKSISSAQHSFAVTGTSITDNVVFSVSADGTLSAQRVLLVTRQADTIFLLLLSALVLMVTNLLHKYSDLFRLL